MTDETKDPSVGGTSQVQDITDDPKAMAAVRQENSVAQVKLAFDPIAQVGNPSQVDAQPVTPNVPWWAPWAAGGLSTTLASIGAAFLTMPGLQIPGIIMTGLAVGVGVFAGVTSRGTGNNPLPPTFPGKK